MAKTKWLLVGNKPAAEQMRNVASGTGGKGGILGTSVRKIGGCSNLFRPGQLEKNYIVKSGEILDLDRVLREQK